MTFVHSLKSLKSWSWLKTDVREIILNYFASSASTNAMNSKSTKCTYLLEIRLDLEFSASRLLSPANMQLHSSIPVEHTAHYVLSSSVQMLDPTYNLNNLFQFLSRNSWPSFTPFLTCNEYPVLILLLIIPQLFQSRLSIVYQFRVP